MSGCSFGHGGFSFASAIKPLRNPYLSLELAQNPFAKALGEGQFHWLMIHHFGP